MSMKVWELLLLGRPIHRFFTHEGVREVLQQVLSDLETDVKGDRDEFARVILESMPAGILPISFSVGSYELNQEDEQEEVTDAKIITYYWTKGLRELDIDIRGARALEKQASVVVLPSVDNDGESGTPKVITIGNHFRATYSRAQRDPSRQELYRVLKAFEASGKKEGSVTLRRSDDISIDEEEDHSLQEEMLEFTVERLNV